MVRARFKTNHVKFVLLGEEAGEAERDHGASGKRIVSVDDSSVTFITHFQRSVEARPIKPKDDSSCHKTYEKHQYVSDLEPWSTLIVGVPCGY